MIGATTLSQIFSQEFSAVQTATESGFISTGEHRFQNLLDPSKRLIEMALRSIERQLVSIAVQ